MQRQEELYHSKFWLTCRTSTSEHVRTSGTWRWPTSSGVPEILTFKNIEIKIQFIKFNQTMVKECGPLNPSSQRLMSKSELASWRLASRTCRMIDLPVTPWSTARCRRSPPSRRWTRLSQLKRSRASRSKSCRRLPRLLLHLGFRFLIF